MCIHTLDDEHLVRCHRVWIPCRLADALEPCWYPPLQPFIRMTASRIDDFPQQFSLLLSLGLVDWVFHFYSKWYVPSSRPFWLGQKRSSHTQLTKFCRMLVGFCFSDHVWLHSGSLRFCFLLSLEVQKFSPSMQPWLAAFYTSF